MALIVEDGTGVANAESLASVAFVDEYHSLRGNAAWAAIATVEVKEQLLRKATDYFVGIYSQSLKGYTVSVDQSLPFPRIVNSVNVGVPLSIKQGIAELALIAKSGPLIPNATRGKKRVKVGPLEVEYDGNSSFATKFVDASLKFLPWVNASSANGAMARLVRC